jgi:tRNA(adenine34) deaminase
MMQLLMLKIKLIQDAGNKLKNYRQINSTIYDSLEPCIMCLGVRISRIVFGAYDTKSGACGSFTNLANTSFFNLKILTEDGILRGAM